MKKYLSALLLALSVASVGAQEFSWKDAIPEIHGTVRGKYEYQTSTNAQRPKSMVRCGESMNIKLRLTRNASKCAMLV